MKYLVGRTNEWVANPLGPGQISALPIKMFICNTRFIVYFVILTEDDKTMIKKYELFVLLTTASGNELKIFGSVPLLRVETYAIRAGWEQ